MATLHVRDVPDSTYEAVRERAAERRTSISFEAIRLIERGLRTDRARVNELLAQIDPAEAVAVSVITVEETLRSSGRAPGTGSQGARRG